jgi:2-oxoisovalerate dehydrogenase E1 component alpha subunit
MQTTARPTHSEIGLSDEQAVALYRTMLLARAVDERQWILNRQGRQAFVISCQGHEAAQVGSASALRPGLDVMVPYYRDLAAAIAFGATPRDALLEALSRADGPWTGGRQMPAHPSSPKLRILGRGSSVGAHIPHAVGAALASRLRGEEALAIVYFGDGATSKGDFHEGLSFAAIHKLPVIFFCEDNGLAISVPAVTQMPVERVADRAAAYNMPGIVVDGTDVLAVYRATREAAERARGGEGPTLIDALCVRLTPHSSDDDHFRYRGPETVESERARDPIPRYGAYLAEAGLLDAEAERRLREEIAAEVRDAADAAFAEPLPEASTALDNVLADRKAEAKGARGLEAVEAPSPQTSEHPFTRA